MIGKILLQAKLEGMPTPEQMILFLNNQLPDLAGKWQYDGLYKTIRPLTPNISFHFDRVHKVVEVFQNTHHEKKSFSIIS